MSSPVGHIVDIPSPTARRSFCPWKTLRSWARSTWVASTIYRRSERGTPSLRLEGPGHPRRLRRHDRQRQDRALCIGSARGGGDRRHPLHRHRPQGRPGRPDAHLPRASGPRTSVPGSTRKRPARRASRRTISPSSRPKCGRRVWPIGDRTPARIQRLQGRRRLRHLHARLQRRPAGEHPQVVRRACPGRHATTPKLCATASTPPSPASWAWWA